MNRYVSAKLTVDQLLTAEPRTATAFLILRTGCVGCHLARFCTLEDVARVYELPLQGLLDKVQESIHLPPTSPEE